jgi:hypothetical protein
MGRPGRGLRLAVTLLIVALLAGLAARALLGARRAERGAEPGVERSGPAERAPDEGRVVALGRAAQGRAGLKIATLAAHSVRAELVAYGSLQEDPARSFVLRAPVAGQIRRIPGRDLPGLGDVLADGEVVGLLEPRLGAMEHVDLTARLATARAEADAARAALTAARAALARLRLLNAENKIASDRAVQEAEVTVKSEEARLAALDHTVQTLELALAGGAGPGSARALVAERGGEVVEVLAQPGEIVGAGEPILRLNRLDRLLVRIALPVGEAADPAQDRARVVALGREDRVLTAERIALTAGANPAGRGQVVLFRVRRVDPLLRPGTPVTVYLPRSGPARRGVVVPRSAIVRAEGSAWVYEQLGDGAFARREVELDQPVASGWFVSSLSPGARVVVAGAQTLLSEEFKAQIPIDDGD